MTTLWRWYETNASAEPALLLLALSLASACGSSSRDVSQDAGARDAGEADSGRALMIAGQGGSGSMDAGPPAVALEPFSFFVTSLEIMRELSGSPDGFGGDLRFDQPDGLSGADAICQEAASRVGFGAKTWRAFLSATNDGSGNPVHAIDRIGDGPWYDRNARLVAEDRAGLLADRPVGDAATVNDLPNEFGEGLSQYGDTHDILTGSNAQGQLDSPDAANTCNDWTSTTAVPVGGGFGFPGGFNPFAGFDGGTGFPFGPFDPSMLPDGGSAFGPLDPSMLPDGGLPFGGGNPGGLRVGHSWPAFSGTNWIDSHSETSCAPGVNLVQNGPGDGSSVGAGGGWGAIYCFALTP